LDVIAALYCNNRDVPFTVPNIDACVSSK